MCAYECFASVFSEAERGAGKIDLNKERRLFMDRRIVKTKKRITGAFIELLEKYSRDRIRVKDICEHAKINKTTFYKHYVDSDELATEIDDTVTDRVVDGFPERGELLSEPEAYVEGLSEAIERETDKLTVVYRGRVDFFVC